MFNHSNNNYHLNPWQIKRQLNEFLHSNIPLFVITNQMSKVYIFIDLF